MTTQDPPNDAPTARTDESADQREAGIREDHAANSGSRNSRERFLLSRLDSARAETWAARTYSKAFKAGYDEAQASLSQATSLIERLVGECTTRTVKMPAPLNGRWCECKICLAEGLESIGHYEDCPLPAAVAWLAEQRPENKDQPAAQPEGGE